MNPIKGIDVSSHQDPKSINYAELAKTHKFVICRGTYGERVDTSFLDHVARAKAVGLHVGAYLFYRAGQDPADQVSAFGEIFTKANLGTGSLVPALDVERNEQFDGPFTPERYVDACHTIAEMFETKWGTPLIYVNPGDWALLGNPTWLADYLLWLADWTPPADLPNGVGWTIWQNKVAPLPGVYSGKIDQDIAAFLPLIGGVV